MKISWSHIEFGRFGATDNYWWVYWWNPLPKHLRYFGYYQEWYDGPFSSFGLWFTNITWRLPWTRHAGKKGFGYSRIVNDTRRRNSVDK